MKAILRCLQAVQGQIPCTDAARRMMRGELTSLITYFGSPSLFVTFNPADVLHPFTWRRGLTTPTTPLPQVQLDQHLLCALRDANLWRMVALDPTAAVEAFHLHVNTFLSTLLKVVPSAQQLPTDGIASIDGQGIFGPLSAAFGVIEPQQRGSLHIHFLLFCYGFQDPHVLVQNFAAQLPLLEERLWAWINSIVVTSFEAIPPMFDLPRSTLENLRPLPYSDAQMKLMHPHYRPHLVAASDHWFAADPNNFLYAHDFIDCPFALTCLCKSLLFLGAWTTLQPQSPHCTQTLHPCSSTIYVLLCFTAVFFTAANQRRVTRAKLEREAIVGYLSGIGYLLAFMSGNVVTVLSFAPRLCLEPSHLTSTHFKQNGTISSSVA